MTEQTEAGNAQAQPEAKPEPGRLEQLEQKLAAAERARDDYLELARQGRREFEGYQQRFQRDLATERRYAQTPLAGDLLPVIDNLERALDAAAKAGDRGALAQGVGMVRQQLLDVLRRHGVTRMEADGQPFDANLHEAVMQQPSGDVPAQTVLQVLESGYLIHERVLRPARVIVSTTP